MFSNEAPARFTGVDERLETAADEPAWVGPAVGQSPPPFSSLLEGLGSRIGSSTTTSTTVKGRAVLKFHPPFVSKSGAYRLVAGAIVGLVALIAVGAGAAYADPAHEIGRASCRERV